MHALTFHNFSPESLERERKSNARLKAAIRSALDGQGVPQEGATQEKGVGGGQDGGGGAGAWNAQPCPLPPLTPAAHHSLASADTHKANVAESEEDGGGTNSGKYSIYSDF